MKNNKPAIFIDRDGTINVEIHYLHEPEKFQFIEKTIEALRIIKKLEFKLIVITNQGAISKGMYDHKDVELTHNHMINLLEKENIFLDGIYYCPHSSKDNCNCRKPKTGMLEKAIKEHDIDGNNSWMIGDKLSDIEAGNRINLKTILVMTGYGIKHRDLLELSDKKDILLKKPDYFAKDLFEASRIIENKK
jgi:D,D-heptose 1,7-bisphosphate phosphatase